MKTYNQYIREQINHLDEIDPFGEEEWDYDNLSPVLRIARKQAEGQDISYDQMISLYCNNSKLTDLKGIEELISLESLFCNNNLLTSLEEIKNLPNLRYIFCFFNNFSIEYKNYLREYCKDKNIKLVI